ncbi:MAG TPA: FAD-dependent oxidoreductase [Methanomassiliicoccales archaeon]|nr:FAD-dependent oxidoreductase [Methanomassiliicoccales archaeon]
MRAIVVGSGAGGAMAARQLAKAGLQVLVLEAGGPFKALSRNVTMTEPLRRVGLLGSERNAQRFLSSMWIARSSEELVLVRGIGAGGSTTIACGNMVRATRGLDKIGLDLTPQFEAIEAELRPSTFPRERWRPTTAEMFDVCEGKGLGPEPTPKAMDALRCEACGLCEVGCACGAKWDSRRWLSQAREAGAEVRLESPAARVVVESGRAIGVKAETANGSETLKADVIVLAAGAIGTAQVLRSSALPTEDRLWADIVLTIGGRKEGAEMLCEPPMVWYTRHERFMVSPYLDILSHWFHKPWRKVGVRDRVGVMIKMADDPTGRVEADGTVRKELTSADRDRLDGASSMVEGMMSEAGVEAPFVRGMLNGGHLGGTVPLRREDVGTMHPSILPEGLYVADLSLAPESQGMPTMLTAAALAMRVSERIISQCCFGA